MNELSHIQREYEVTEEDIWAAVNYACEPTDREM